MLIQSGKLSLETWLSGGCRIMISRRSLLEAGGALALTAAGSVPAWSAGAGVQPGEAALSPLLPAGTRAEAVFDTLPGKKPLIKLTYRPPNYEAPLAYLRTAITPNDEFFVRYHLADIPQVDAGTPIDPADAKTIGDYLKENYGE